MENNIASVVGLTSEGTGFSQLFELRSPLFCDVIVIGVETLLLLTRKHPTLNCNQKTTGTRLKIQQLVYAALRNFLTTMEVTFLNPQSSNLWCFNNIFPKGIDSHVTCLKAKRSYKQLFP